MSICYLDTPPLRSLLSLSSVGRGLVKPDTISPDMLASVLLPDRLKAQLSHPLLALAGFERGKAILADARKNGGILPMPAHVSASTPIELPSASHTTPTSSTMWQPNKDGGIPAACATSSAPTANKATTKQMSKGPATQRDGESMETSDMEEHPGEKPRAGNAKAGGAGQEGT